MMVKTKFIVPAALLALTLSSGAALAVPYCTPHASGFSFKGGFGNSGLPKRDYDSENQTYAMELARRGYDTTRVETWNGCIRAWVRNGAGGEDMMFFDPNTFQQVH